MNVILKNIVNIFSPFFDTKSLIKWTGQKNVFPFYHAISDEKLPFISPLYRHKNIQEFENDLDYLLKYYRPIGLDELLEHKKNNTSLQGVFHLSFDDGLSNFYHTIAPILKRKGIPATVFLNADFIDNKKLFYRYKSALLIGSLKEIPGKTLPLLAEILNTNSHTTAISQAILKITYQEEVKLDELAALCNLDFNDYLKKNQPYLNSNQIKALTADGFTFGSHSLDHPLYQTLNFNEQLRQTKESTHVICNNFNLDYRVFSFPFTDYGVSKKFFNTCLKEESILQLSFGCAGIKHDSNSKHIQRLDMEKNATDPADIIKIELLYYLLKMCFGKNHIKRK